MRQSNHTCKICFLDRIWYVGERMRETGSPTSGGQILFLGWLFAVVVPLGVPLAGHYLDWVGRISTFVLLIFLPVIFCKLRYTPSLTAAIRERCRNMKRIGRKFALILLGIAALTATN